MKHRKNISFILFLLFLSENIYSQESSLVHIYAKDTIAIHPDIFGINNDWRMISDVAFPEFAEAMDMFDNCLLRYPGGWESEFLDWESNLTAGWDNAPDVPGASIATVRANTNHYSIVIPTQQAMNKSVGSAAWNSAIVQLKEVAEEAINLAGPDVLTIVEIGNEWWLQAAGGVSRANKLIKYGKIADELAGFINETYPDRSFYLLVNGDYSLPSEFNSLRDNITSSYDLIDGLALHTYTGYNTSTHNISDLGDRILTCSSNFNPNKQLFIYLSEWMPSRAYNDYKLYMEAANIIPDIIQIYARSGADAAAYWPPVNSSIPGLGVFNWNASVIYPVGQILGDMSQSYKGYALKTVSEEVKVAAALVDSKNIVLYVSGLANLSTDVLIDIDGFDIDIVKSCEKFRPNDYTATSKAAACVIEDAFAEIENDKLAFTINELGKYDIFKIELQGSIEDSGNGIESGDPLGKDYILYSRQHTLLYESKDGKAKKVSIYDIWGRCLKSFEEASFNYVVPASGVYFIRVGEGKDRFIKSIII